MKTTESGGPRGYDAGKKIKGRKRQLAVDLEGLPLAIQVHEASVQDRDSAPEAILELLEKAPTVKKLFADGGYAGPKLAERLQELGLSDLLEIVPKPKGEKGFTVLSHRWVVERTFSWLGRCRRLAKDFEIRAKARIRPSNPCEFDGLGETGCLPIHDAAGSKMPTDWKDWLIPEMMTFRSNS